MLVNPRFPISKPYFSVVIPTYNRPLQLANCLTSLVKLDYPHDYFEVIIVDDGSKVSLKETIAPFYKLLNLTLVIQSNAGPATARNTGAKVARGSVLAFIDDDCQPDAHWLGTLERYFIHNFQASEQPHVVGGRVYNILTGNNYAIASQALVNYLYQCYNADKDNCGFFTSNNLAVSAADFHAIGGFDETFPLAAAEDREFCDRCLSERYRLIYAPEVVVNHTHNLTLESFWTQQFNYGRGAHHLYRKRATQGLQQVKRQPWTFYLGLLLYPFFRYCLPQAFVIACLFLVSQIAVFVGLSTGRN